MMMLAIAANSANPSPNSTSGGEPMKASNSTYGLQCSSGPTEQIDSSSNTPLSMKELISSLSFTVTDADTVSSMSSDDDEGSTKDSESAFFQDVQDRPRSIFNNYWKRQPESISEGDKIKQKAPSSCGKHAEPSSRTSSASFSDHQRLLRFRIRQHHERLQKDQRQQLLSVTHEDNNSANTYEKVLNQCETGETVERNSHSKPTRARPPTPPEILPSRPYQSRPLLRGNISLLTQSAPSLKNGMTSPAELMHASRTKAAQSDSALVMKPLKSALRRGRFSNSTPIEHSQCPQSFDETKLLVEFHPVIQVYAYERPVESYAQTGWSSWFGF